ncbi:hypothetical protein KC950_04185, partial [Candidatus Saccharibacteria bacterium]|nr:hypothetical protein [Candidatus Saccharibacteria bacterium]
MGKNNFFYFFGTGIGGYLLAMHALEVMYFSVDVKERGKCVIVCSKGAGLFSGISHQYPHIEVVEINRRTPKSFFYILKFIFGKNFIIFAPAFGNPSPLHLLAATLLRCGHPFKSRLTSFLSPNFLTRLLFTDLFARHKTHSLFHQMSDVAKKLGFTKTKNINLLYETSTMLLPEHTGAIIFHPFASNERREFPEKRN